MGEIPSRQRRPQTIIGAVVQLVRIPACHAGGRGFESRPLRQLSRENYEVSFSCSIDSGNKL